MKNKFYYNGELVRTSDKEYHFGIVCIWKEDNSRHFISCHTTKDMAIKARNARYAYAEKYGSKNDYEIVELTQG